MLEGKNHDQTSQCKQASNESNPITYFRSIEKQISKGQGSEADVGKEDEKVVGFFHRSHATAQ